MNKPRGQKSIKLSLSKKQSTITAFFEKPKINHQHDSTKECGSSLPADTDNTGDRKRKIPEDSPDIIPATPERIKPRFKKQLVKKLKQNFENITTNCSVAETVRNREAEPKKLLAENNASNIMQIVTENAKNQVLEKDQLESIIDLDSGCLENSIDVRHEHIKLPDLERLSKSNDSEKEQKIEVQKVSNSRLFNETETVFCAAQKLTEEIILNCTNSKSDAVQERDAGRIHATKENKATEVTRSSSTEKRNGNSASSVKSTEDEADLQVVMCNFDGCEKSTVAVQSCTTEGDKCLNTEVTEQKEAIICRNFEKEEFASNDSLLLDDWHTDQLKNWELEDMEQNTESQLQLDALKRCEVVEVRIIDGGAQLLTLKCGTLKTTCLLKDFWAHSVVQVGDTVMAQGRKASQESSGEWVIDNMHGFLVQQPDTLVSSTSVVGSLFCARRGVLQECFRGLDSDSPILVIGSLVHLLFQEVLKRKLASEEEVAGVVKELLARPSSVCMLYGANMTLETGIKELMAYVPHIVEFIATYVQRRRSPPSESWQGSLCGIQDIEDNIWVPGFGIKGKVDVSAEVRIHNRTKMMPLELKTGRASFSAEHKGQVMLYTMMMSELGDNVNSGLLLYLRGCVMQEVHTNHKEKRDLILLRNNLAHYLKQAPELASGIFRPPPLPGPISHRNACTKCPYLTLCSAYLSRDGLSQLSSEHPLKCLSSEATSHLKSTHIDYLIHWGALMTLETAEDSLQHKDLWCKTPSEREKQGRCICNLVIKGEVETTDEGMFVHILQKANGSTSDLHSNIFTKGDYIVVSTDIRPAVTTGTVLNVTEEDIQLLLNKNLMKGSTSKMQYFHVDFGAYSGGKTFNLTNLGHLLEDTPITERLRRLIIDKDAPSFTEKLPSNVLHLGRKILRPLNVAQRRAVIKALTANDYLLIKGMPGTGKTQTIVAMVELMVKLGYTVLITSHTHSAVDNVLLKLATRGVDFLRLGSTTRIHPDLRSWGEAALTSGCSDPTHLAKLYSSKAVVATTCLGAGHTLLTKRTFDTCIVDESTQVLQVSVLRSLFSASRFILIGDPNQLPPVVRNKTARELGMSESLFARLDGEATVCLDLQYRMNQTITDLANKFTYEEELKCGNSDIANSVLNLPHLDHLEKDICEQHWLQNITSSDLKYSVLFLDTGCQTDSVNNLTNVHEAALIFHVIQIFLKGGVSEKDIGVIAPYRAQVALLAKILSVEVNTVDQYQGRDKNIIIFSCTRSGQGSSNKDKETEILSDHQRLTVAITRAKQKLLLVGDYIALKKYSTFQKLFSCFTEEQTVHLSDGTNGFFWKGLMDPIKDHLTE